MEHSTPLSLFPVSSCTAVVAGTTAQRMIRYRMQAVYLYFVELVLHRSSQWDAVGLWSRLLSQTSHQCNMTRRGTSLSICCTVGKCSKAASSPLLWITPMLFLLTWCCCDKVAARLIHHHNEKVTKKQSRNVSLKSSSQATICSKFGFREPLYLSCTNSQAGRQAGSSSNDTGAKQPQRS